VSLRFAKIKLSNPARADIAPVEVSAVVTAEPFGLAVGPMLADKLKLEPIDTRTAFEVGGGARQLPYVGPLRIAAGGREAFTGAIRAATGVVIGGRLAQELGLDHIDDSASFASSTAPSQAAEATSPDDGDVSRIMIREDAVDPKPCAAICIHAAARADEAAPARVAAPDGGDSRVASEIRSTAVVPTRGITPLLNDIVSWISNKYLEPFFGAQVEWWEAPKILRYRPGDRYGLHADGERLLTRPGEPKRWERILDRDVSLIVYLNDGFVGGKLHFPDQALKVEPKPGMMVAFPSSGAYRHEAEPTESGERLALVSWVGLAGRPRIKGRPEGSILKATYRPGRDRGRSQPA
jgi:predicted 2-oxoglutarate/Fe(II)-dependent dioxygenase YbiX